MANIKITELNEILKKDNADVLPIVDVSANETKKIAIEDLLDKNIALIAVTDTEPAECSTGDKYYNTTTKKIYTAINTNVWGEDGEDPISGILYIVYDEQASYSWDGTDLVSVGGGKEDIVISDTQPTDPDVKLWIDTGEIGSQVSEITNEYSTSTGLGYSANYVNNLHTYSTTEQRIGTWSNGRTLYRKVIEFIGTPDNIPHNISNLSAVTKASGIVYRTEAVVVNQVLPHMDTDLTWIMDFNYFSSTNIVMLWGSQIKTHISGGYIILEYYKSTD